MIYYNNMRLHKYFMNQINNKMMISIKIHQKIQFLNKKYYNINKIDLIEKII